VNKVTLAPRLWNEEPEVELPGVYCHQTQIMGRKDLVSPTQEVCTANCAPRSTPFTRDRRCKSTHRFLECSLPLYGKNCVCMVRGSQELLTLQRKIVKIEIVVP
jgi:hypothetical protein